MEGDIQTASLISTNNVRTYLSGVHTTVLVDMFDTASLSVGSNSSECPFRILQWMSRHKRCPCMYTYLRMLLRIGPQAQLL